MNTNKITEQIADGLALTTSYQDVNQPEGFGSIHGKGGQVVLTFKRTGGTSVTFKVDELFSYKDASDNQVVGWTTRKIIDSAGTGMDDIEITETDNVFSFAFTTLADRVKVQVKGAGGESLDLLLTVGSIE